MHTTPDVLTLLALGEPAATSDEQVHLAECPVCTAELEELTRVVDAARHAVDDDALARPRPVVWQNIQREIQAGRSTSAPAATATAEATTAPRTQGPRHRRAYALVAAAALVAGLGGGFGIARSFQPQVAARPTHLNALPSWPGAEGHAEIEDNAQGQQVLSVQVSMPEATDGKLEVWLSDDRSEHMSSMGFLNGTSGTFAIPAGFDIKQSPVIDISLEPKDDRNPAHSGVSVVRGRLVR